MKNSEIDATRDVEREEEAQIGDIKEEESQFDKIKCFYNLKKYYLLKKEYKKIKEVIRKQVFFINNELNLTGIDADYADNEDEHVKKIIKKVKRMKTKTHGFFQGLAVDRLLGLNKKLEKLENDEKAVIEGLSEEIKKYSVFLTKEYYLVEEYVYDNLGRMILDEEPKVLNSILQLLKKEELFEIEEERIERKIGGMGKNV